MNTSIVVLVILLNITCSYTLYNLLPQGKETLTDAVSNTEGSDSSARVVYDESGLDRNKWLSKYKHVYNGKGNLAKQSVIASDFRKPKKIAIHYNKGKKVKDIKMFFKDKVKIKDIDNRIFNFVTIKPPIKKDLFVNGIIRTDQIYRLPSPIERLIFACRSTDLACFQLQYQSIRDNILLGNTTLGIPPYEEYIFKYTVDTCVRMGGWKESELAMISLDGSAKKMSIAFELPVRIREVKASGICNTPDIAFNAAVAHSTGGLRKFTGNALVLVSYPFILRRNRGLTHMHLGVEDIDVTYNIPDWSHLKNKPGREALLYEWSEWAYDMVRHVNAAEHFVKPYTDQLRVLLKKVPFSRFFMLYPGEVFLKLNFSLATENYRNKLALDAEPLTVIG